MNLKVGDWVNDWDHKFPAGPVVAVDPRGQWFEVEWERGGVRYVKRHHDADLDPGRKAGSLFKI